MITQSIILQTTLWWFLTTAVGGDGVVVPAAGQVQITTNDAGGGISLPAIPKTNEDSVHLLSAFRFPPPALLFVDPNKKWVLGDFEKPDRPTVYAVTDDDNEGEEGEQTAWTEPKDPKHTPTTVPKPETTTTVDEPVGCTTTVQHEETTADIPHATTVAAATDNNPSRQSASDGQQSVTHGRPDRESATDGRIHRHPVALGRPSHSIMLTGRPLPPPPTTGVRFINGYRARYGTPYSHDFHRLRTQIKRR